MLGRRRCRGLAVASCALVVNALAVDVDADFLEASAAFLAKSGAEGEGRGSKRHVFLVHRAPCSIGFDGQNLFAICNVPRVVVWTLKGLLNVSRRPG